MGLVIHGDGAGASAAGMNGSVLQAECHLNALESWPLRDHDKEVGCKDGMSRIQVPEDFLHIIWATSCSADLHVEQAPHNLPAMLPHKRWLTG